jgi:hypothetical protein
MRSKRVLVAGIALFGLVLLPLSALLYYVLHLKGASFDWTAPDLNAFLAGLGLDLPDWKLGDLLDQVANASERADDTGSREGVTGGTGIGAGGSLPARPNDPLEREIDKYEDRMWERLKEGAEKAWEEISDALSMKPLPPDSSSGGSGSSK